MRGRRRRRNVDERERCQREVEFARRAKERNDRHQLGQWRFPVPRSGRVLFCFAFIGSGFVCCILACRSVNGSGTGLFLFFHANTNQILTDM